MRHAPCSGTAARLRADSHTICRAQPACTAAWQSPKRQAIPRVCRWIRDAANSSCQDPCRWDCLVERWCRVTALVLSVNNTGFFQCQVTLCLPHADLHRVACARISWSVLYMLDSVLQVCMRLPGHMLRGGSRDRLQ